MKLSSETITILKNFGAINQGIYFRQGKELKTVSSHKNILAKATIKEDIPRDFGIYDLNNFLSVVSLHKDDPVFDFDEKHVQIIGNSGRSKMKYRFCEPTMIVVPPEKALVMPEPEISLQLTAADFDWIMRAASVLSCPHVAIESDGEKMFITTLDMSNDSAHTDSLEISGGNNDKYRMIFKTENLSKILSGAYELKISSKGISHFKNKDIDLEYHISIEQGSKYTKGS